MVSKNLEKVLSCHKTRSQRSRRHSGLWADRPARHAVAGTGPRAQQSLEPAGPSRADAAERVTDGRHSRLGGTGWGTALTADKQGPESRATWAELDPLAWGSPDKVQ